jgi:GDP-6-deoxy-D-talose 4-dehydrogenase
LRVLLTGADGFTGPYVRAELEAHGHQVVELSADLTDPVAVLDAVRNANANAVIHLAGVAFVAEPNARPFYEVNLLGTLNFLDALCAASAPPHCVLLASSANVYGNQAIGEIREDTAPNPANDYAVSKWSMEVMARLRSRNLPMVIARPFNYTGVGQTTKFLVPKIVEHFRQSAKAIQLGNLDVSRDFSDVRAVAVAYRRLIEAAPVGQTINVCSGRAVALREIIRHCEELTGQSIRIEANPAFIRTDEIATLNGSNRRLLDCIGEWSTPPIRETLRWMLELPT